MTEMTDPALADTTGADAPEAAELPIVRPAQTARRTASALIAVTAAIAVLAGWQSWRSYAAVRDPGAVAPVDSSPIALEWVWLAALVASCVAFSAWLWAARLNSERICAAPHRLRARWALWAWLVPGVNLWWPRVVLADVWRASNPDVPPIGADLRQVRPGRLIGVWWVTFLLAHAIGLFGVLRPAPGVRTVQVSALLPMEVAGATVGALAVVSAASILYVMRRVDRWQTGRDAVR